MAATTGFDGEIIGPLAFDGVKNVFFFPGGVERCGEGVLLARDPAFAGVVYFRDKAGGGGNVGAVVELDEGFAIYETFDVEGGEGDEVGFVIGSYGEEGVADLFDVDCAREGGFLSIVTLELDGDPSLVFAGGQDCRQAYLYAMFIVPYAVGCRWRMMAVC